MRLSTLNGPKTLTSTNFKTINKFEKISKAGKLSGPVCDMQLQM